MTTIVKSIFLDTVSDLPPEPIPSKIMKAAKKDGKLIYIAVERKTK